jgi:hypothetical protein
VLDIEQYYPVFKAMEEHGLILNLHGEMISSPPAEFAKTDGTAAVTVLNAERMFLPQLHKLHSAFPKLRIILEHISTREGLAAVQQCGPTVKSHQKDPTQNMKASRGQKDIRTFANVNRRWLAPSQPTICGRLSMMLVETFSASASQLQRYAPFFSARFLIFSPPARIFSQMNLFSPFLCGGKGMGRGSLSESTYPKWGYKLRVGV